MAKSARYSEEKRIASAWSMYTAADFLVVEARRGVGTSETRRQICSHQGEALMIGIARAIIKSQEVECYAVPLPY